MAEQLERGTSATQLMGAMDEPKLRSAAALFEMVSRPRPAFSSGGGGRALAPDAEVNAVCRRVLLAMKAPGRGATVPRSALSHTSPATTRTGLARQAWQPPPQASDEGTSSAADGSDEDGSSDVDGSLNGAGRGGVAKAGGGAANGDVDTSEASGAESGEGEVEGGSDEREGGSGESQDESGEEEGEEEESGEDSADSSNDDGERAGKHGLEARRKGAAGRRGGELSQDGLREAMGVFVCVCVRARVEGVGKVWGGCGGVHACVCGGWVWGALGGADRSLPKHTPSLTNVQE